MKDLTHADLVELGRRWLLKSPYNMVRPREHVSRTACSVIATEVTSHALETPDVLGWASVSVLIECKASRADFLADKRKDFRKTPENGMGVLRYYLAPAGLLREEEIPQGWGFLVAVPRPSKRGHVIHMLRESKLHEAAYVCEAEVLVCILRGLHVRPGPHLTINAYTFPTKKRGTLTMRVTA